MGDLGNNAITISLCFLVLCALTIITNRLSYPEQTVLDPTGLNLIYIKVPKTASSTSAGIFRNIGHRRGLAGARDFWDFSTEPGVWSNHAPLAKIDHKIERLVLPYFLATFVRHPASRALSNFYWEANVRSANHDWGASESRKMAYLGLIRNSMTAYLRPTKRREDEAQTSTAATAATAPADSNEGLQLADVDEILKLFDFIGLFERYDESLIVLMHRLGLSLFDILYLSAKIPGKAVYPGMYASPTHPSPSEESPAIFAFINTSFLPHNQLDLYLYNQAQLRLDEEIRRIGNSFHLHLAEFNALKLTATAECLNGSAEDDCLWRDNGCGFRCFQSFEAKNLLHQTLAKSDARQ